MGVIHNHSEAKNKKYIHGKGLVKVHYKKHVYGKGLVDTFMNLVSSPKSVDVIKDVVEIGRKVKDIKDTIKDMRAMKIAKIKDDIKQGGGFKYV